MDTGDNLAPLGALRDLWEALSELSDDQEIVRRLIAFVAEIQESTTGEDESSPGAAVTGSVTDVAAFAAICTSARGCAVETERQSWRDAENALRRTHQDLLKKSMALRERTMVDELTGLFNRRYFERSLGYDVERFQRYGRPLGVVLFDVDHFKKINDTYGHSIGDAALRHLADLARETIRGADMVARYGGEEFVLLLPETGAEGAVVLAERLRRRVAESPLATEKGALQMTVSLGVFAVEGEFSGSAEEVMRIVDNALYAAKDAGRNCSVLA